MPPEIAIRPLVLQPPHARFTVRRDVKYFQELEADIFAPEQAARRPAIIFIHGGPVPDGSKPKRMRVFSDYGALAATSGFTGIIFNHRFFGDALEQAANDVAALIEFARTQPEVDPQRIVLWAFSGGGPFLSFAFDGGVRAIVSYYGVLDAPIARLSPLQLLKSGSPCPPILIARAGKDHPQINHSVDVFLAEALRRNVELELLAHPNGEHGFDIVNDDDRSRAIIRRTIEFVREHA